MLAYVIFIIPTAILQLWVNYPINLIKAGKSELSVHEAYLEHRRRSVKGAKIILLFLLILFVLSLRLWYNIEQEIDNMGY